MKLVAWSELDDEERRVASAQMIVLLVCVSPLLGLLAALVGMLFGSRAFATAFAAEGATGPRKRSGTTDRGGIRDLWKAGWCSRTRRTDGGRG